MGFWDQYVGGSSSSASQNNSAPAAETSTPSNDSGNNWGGSGNTSGSSGSNEYLGEYWSSQAANSNNNADTSDSKSNPVVDTLKDIAGRDGNSVWTNALFGSSDSSAKATQPQNSNTQVATAATTGQTPATGQTSSVLDNSDYYNFARNPAFRQYLQQRDPNAFNEGMQRMQSSNPYLDFDTSNAYGRTGSGYNDYSYSYHTQQLQHQLNQQIMRSNAQARQNGQPQQPLLKEDGLMGYKTMQAMQQYGIDMGMGGSYSGGSTTGGATTGGSGQSPQGMAPSGGRTPPSTSQGNGSPRNPNGYVPVSTMPEAANGMPLEYSDAFIRQQDMNDAYSPNQTFNGNYMAQLEAMQNPQRPSQAGDSMSRALENYQQPTTDIEALYDDYQSRVQQQDNNRELQYGRQFMEDMRQLRQQFPTYSDTALFDMALFNEEMRNGQSSYYKWLAKQLG